MSDHVTEMLLDQLIAFLDNEPPDSAGGHPSMAMHERYGNAWADWDRQVSGLRTMLGVRLVNDAVKARKEARNTYEMYLEDDNEQR